MCISGLVVFFEALADAHAGPAPMCLTSLLNGHSPQVYLLFEVVDLIVVKIDD
jgi:hypothetical protein